MSDSGVQMELVQAKLTHQPTLCIHQMKTLCISKTINAGSVPASSEYNELMQTPQVCSNYHPVFLNDLVPKDRYQ